VTGHAILASRLRLPSNPSPAVPVVARAEALAVRFGGRPLRHSTRIGVVAARRAA
jgi:hypothetical protein